VVVLRRPRKMLLAYGAIWAIYIVFHVLLSKFASYDSLIPAWKLRA
jgi:hypothetical protein